jgi:hypothetical protein
MGRPAFQYLQSIPVRLFAYQAAAGSTSIHAPTAGDAQLIEYPSLDALVAARMGRPAPSATQPPPLPPRRTRHAHVEFDIVRRAWTRQFFAACDATHAGITNYSDAENARLNLGLREVARAAEAATRDAAAPATFLGDVDHVTELGAGTGRLASELAALFAADALASRRHFLFCEPDDRLRAACAAAVERAFFAPSMPSAAGRDRSTVAVRGYDTDALIKHRLASLFPQDAPADAPCRLKASKDMLVMSGVAQYMSDCQLTTLLSTFPRVLLQEDVVPAFVARDIVAAAAAAPASIIDGSQSVGEEPMAAVVHDRDGSFVRSPAYFAALFSAPAVRTWRSCARPMRVLATDVNECQGCLTMTWALEAVASN